jgi:hypothetical protein
MPSAKPIPIISEMAKKSKTKSQQVTTANSTPVKPVMNLQPPQGHATEAEKEIAFYSSLVQAWIDTRMELDRTLVTLSAGGIGLLATLLTTVGVVRRWHLWFYALSALGFLIALIVELVIFKKNAAIIEEIIGGGGRKTGLKHLDGVGLVSFGVGAAALLLIGVFTATTPKEGFFVTKKGETTRPVQPPAAGDSFKKSLDGIQNLMPKPPASGQPTTGSGTSKAPTTPSPKK